MRTWAQQGDRTAGIDLMRTGVSIWVRMGKGRDSRCGQGKTPSREMRTCPNRASGLLVLIFRSSRWSRADGWTEARLVSSHSWKSGEDGGDSLGVVEVSRGGEDGGECLGLVEISRSCMLVASSPESRSPEDPC